jgi:hypothetical protein
MATELDCADALLKRARALLTGQGFTTMEGITSGDERWTGPVLRAAAILAAAGAAILVDLAVDGDESDLVAAPPPQPMSDT